MTHDELRAALADVLPDALDVVVAREREASDEHTLAEVESERANRNARETRVMRWVIAPLMVAALGGGGAGMYQNMTAPRNITDAVDKRVDDLETVIKGCPNGETCAPKAKAASLSGRVDNVEKRTDRLGHLHMGQRELVLDIRDELADKLDALSPLAADVKAPESLGPAREQVDAYKALKASKEADAAMSKGDPFAGLED